MDSCITTNCVSADGEKLYGYVPTKYDYALPLCLHTCLCPQQGGNPFPSRSIDEDDLCRAHCLAFLFNNMCLALSRFPQDRKPQNDSNLQPWRLAGLSAPAAPA